MVDSLDDAHEAAASEPKFTNEVDVEQSFGPERRKVRGFSV